MLGRVLLGAGIWLIGIAVDPGLAMDCPTPVDYDQTEKKITDAPTCDASMQLLMACQLGSSGDVARAMIVIKKCEGDFLESLSASARRGYEPQGRRLRR